MEAFDSGMLRPKKTQLAVFGLTRHTERLQRLTSLVPCESCSFGPCQYRRAPYRRAPRPTGEQASGSRLPALDQDAAVQREPESTEAMGRGAPFDASPSEDGSLDACFATTEPLAPTWAGRWRFTTT